MAEPSGRVDARSQPEGDRAGVHGGRVDARGAHERLQPRLVRSRQPPHSRGHERAVLVQERHHVGHRRQGDEVEVAVEPLGAERHEQLVDDAGAAQLGERVLGGPGGDDRAVGQGLAGPVVVCDDDLEAGGARLGHLLDRSDPAVDREQKRTFLAGQPCQGLAGHAVALLEAARKVPVDLRAQPAERGDGQRGRADAVDVVVPVDADAAAGGDRLVDERARLVDVAEQPRVVLRRLGGEEGLRLLGVAVAPPDEDACRRLAQSERLGELPDLLAGARTHRPGALVHLDPR